MSNSGTQTNNIAASPRIEFIRYSPFRNPIATSPRYRGVIKLPF